MSPKVPGKDYYVQDSPSKRGFPQRGFRISEDEAALFDQDAKASEPGTISGYLWALWEADRARRGLPPVAEAVKARKEQ